MNIGEMLSNPITQQAIAWAIPLVLPFIVAAIGWLLIFAIKLVTTKVKESQTKMDDYILGVAVKFVEDKFGPETGEEKLHAACEYVEKVTKGRLNHDVLLPLVRAKYQDVFGVLSSGKNV